MARGAKTTGDKSEEEMFHLSGLSFYFTVTQRLAGPRLGFAILYSIVGPLPCCLLSQLYWNGHFGAIFVTERSCVAPNVESGTSHIGWVSSTLIKRVISEASLFPLLLFIYYRDMS